MFDLIIVGGGPAGLTAGVYALQKRMETLILAQQLGGQARYSFQLDAMEGHEIITGRIQVDKFRAQIEYLDFAREVAEVTKIERKDDHFVVTTGAGNKYESLALIYATGVETEQLDVPGEIELRGRGVTYSAMSHAPMFLGRDVAVVGNGERAVRAAAELSLLANKVFFLKDGDLPDGLLADHVLGTSRVEMLDGYKVDEIVGATEVHGLVASKNGDWMELDVQGVFIELGLKPNSELIRDWVACTPDGYVKVDAGCATDVPGLFAAGDVADSFDEQVLIAVGAGATAALSAYEYLLGQGRLPAWTDKAPEKLVSM